ncbi:MAG: lysophospholipid acyltransferase family protein [Myxococcota bacterium]
MSSTLAGWEVKRRVTDESRLPEAADATKRKLAKKILNLLAIERSWDGVIPPASGPRLIVANHRTALDIGVLMERAGGHFLSRDDLAEWPVIGPLAKHGGTIFVERGNKRSGARAIRAIRRHLADGATVVVYPEGSTYRGDEVRPFLGGAFSAAKATKAEILPVGLAYPEGVEFVDMGFMAHVGSIAARPRTPVTVVVGEPLGMDVEGGKTAAVAAHARNVVQSLVDRARAGFPG